MNSNYSQPTPQQPQILLQLRQKSSQLRQFHASLKDQNKVLSHQFSHLSDRLNVLLQEKDIQERKSRSLMLLVTDIQRQLDDTYMEVHTEEEPEKLEGENRILRQILIKIAELVKEDQKLLSFMRQTAASGPKAVEFVQRSRYLEGQTQLLAKLKSQISSFSNQNLECSRKWNDLEMESSRLQNQQGLFRIQAERLKRDLKEHYEDYLQRLNRSKAVLVNYNQTQRQRVVTQYLVEEVALLQQKRVSVQEQLKNLNHHQESLLQQNARIQTQNKELKSFFTTPQNNEEHRLATKMKMRIEELRDSLSELQKIRNIPQLPLSDVAETVRNKLRQIEESQNYIEKKVRQEEQGKIVIEEKDVINFFEGVMRGRDERIQIAKQKQSAVAQKLRQSSIRRQLLQSQVQNLEQGLKYHHYENVGTRMAGVSFVQPENQNIQKVSKWKRDNKILNATNFLTTASKFVN